MPLLDRNGSRDEIWRQAEDGAVDKHSHVLLRWDEVQAGFPSTRPDQRVGVSIPNTLQVASLLPFLSGLTLIAIGFPSHGDGRGFSLAWKLRDAGFTGILRASGPLIPDQFAYALACGFDEIDLPEASATRQPVSQWPRAAAAMSATYQRGYGEQLNILDQRRSARANIGRG